MTVKTLKRAYEEVAKSRIELFICYSAGFEAVFAA